MRAVLAYPGNMAHAQNAALALHEIGQLDAFVSSFVWRRESLMAAALRTMEAIVPLGVERHLARRTIGAIPSERVHAFPVWEMLRTAAIKLPLGKVAADLAWDRASFAFDGHVARHYVPRADLIVAFEYTALAGFRRARELGKARVLHLPSLDSRRFEDIQRREREQWPELRQGHDGYFAARFERRYARRCEEIALADVVIANSSLTRQSHIEAGADPEKVFACPLGAPPAVSESALKERPAERPLKVVWAGSFSLGKGAHYMLAAWRRLSAGAAATLEVYGAQLLPPRLAALDASGIRFHGSVPQPQLFQAFLDADVLVFPTLSDGFGMVVAEALAHGLPVIATDQAGAMDLLTADNGLVVPAADAAALADALQWCLDNRQRLCAMRLGALRAAERRQWSAFRSDLISALDVGLARVGRTFRKRTSGEVAAAT